MLTTRQRTFRKFWHAIMPLHDLASGPKPFRLMGEDIVLFLDAEGRPAALKDRCVHRTAKLSLGACVAGRLQCGYHGWTYDRTGAVVAIPQLEAQHGLPSHRTPAYHCTAKYGYAWVALEDPIAPIFDIPEDADPAYRRIFQFYQPWNTSPVRFMENSFDNAHFAYVHTGTFGIGSQPKPKVYDIVDTEYGFYAASKVEILNPPIAHRVTGSSEPTTTRDMRNAWYMPFSRRMDMTYPSGIRHIIINCTTPIDDRRIQVIQLLYRNDTEADCPEQLLIDWDAQIIAEDRAILESTDPDATVDVARKIEAHMPSDRPGLLIRKRLLEVLRANGEEEIHARSDLDFVLGARAARAPVEA